MQSTKKDGSGLIEINTRHKIYSVSFAEDGKHLLSGGAEGMLRRWQVEDGREIPEPIKTARAEIYATALSPDRKWLVCGLKSSSRFGKAHFATVWDAQTNNKVLDIKAHTDTVFSVDFSPDSSRFATGGSEMPPVVFVWSVTTGKPLVGPLQHDGWAVVAVRFSPSGDRIATATADNPGAKSIRIYDSNNGQRLLDIPFNLGKYLSPPLTWSVDGCQLFAASQIQVKRFDTSSGFLLSEWSVPGGGAPTSIALSRNQRFIAVVANKSLSFWDAVTQEQISSVIGHESTVWSIALSPNDDRIATGEDNGRIIFRSIREILPGSYFTASLPLIDISDAAFKLWAHGNLPGVKDLLTEEILHPPNSIHHARALAYRSLVLSRLKQWDMAINDAKQSINLQRSVIGHIANAISHMGNGDHESAMRVFDLVFPDGPPTENKFFLLIKAVILFLGGKHDDAILRVNDLIDMEQDKPLYITVRAQMLMFLGGLSLRKQDNQQAMEFLQRAREAIPVQENPRLVVISLISGWDFDKLGLAIKRHLQECVKPIECHGDAAAARDANEAILQYSAALSLDPPNPASLFVKRSKAWTTLDLWDEALKDADEAIKADPLSPWGYERKHAALHGSRRYGEALDAFSDMLSRINSSLDPNIRNLGNKYHLPAQSETIIDDVIREVSKLSPFVLIDVKSGQLCGKSERASSFKLEPQFKELLSSMIEGADQGRIQRVVEHYFRYITLSHVWQGKEPLYQDVKSAGSVWALDSSPLNEKLRKFCQVVRSEGYRWAWSDTCCIDKSINAVLRQSLRMMYKWYEASAATFALISSAPSPSALGDLTDSVWMTRAWTAQELLAAKVIRFYDRDWKPYLGDTRFNHKESPEIMQELTRAIGIGRETIVHFSPDDLSVREKLRLASTRRATVEEDTAYSLIGIFNSDIQPNYGEGGAALGHLLEEIVSRSGDVTVLAWAGKPSSYSSCLPINLAVYSQTRHSLAITDTEMDEQVAALRDSLPRKDVMPLYNRVATLSAARFANRRLYLPSIIFAVKNLSIIDFGDGVEYCYCAHVAGLGEVKFQTSDRLPLVDSRRLVFVHPWICDLRDPFDRFIWEDITADKDDDGDDGNKTNPETAADAGTHSMSTPKSSSARASAPMNNYTRALRLVVRLQQPFHTLLLLQQPTGEFRRVAAEHEIVVQGIKRAIDVCKDLCTGIVEIL